MSQSDRLAWQAEALRLSVFPGNPDDATRAEHWPSLFSTPAEMVNRPAHQVPQIIEEGPWNNARLQVVGQPGQIHWRAFSQVPSPEGPMLLGPFSDVMQPFRALMSQWLAQLSYPVNRIAFGANMMLPAPSLPVACRYLDGMLPSVTIDRQETRDFMYRVNRQRDSVHEPSCRINRLATWSVMQSIGLEVIVAPGRDATTRPLSGKHFCRLELDINTVPRNLRPKKLSSVFGELVEAAAEIAERGDVA